MIGLKRGTVVLVPHQEEWIQNAADTVNLLWEILGDAAIDIQHVGSTAITAIHAKPIIDIAVGMQSVDDVKPYIEALAQKDIIYRGQDIEGQMLFVMGDLEEDTRTHHIHVVEWDGTAWNHYLSFRDYLNTHSEKAKCYDACKQELATRFSEERSRYTAGKQDLIAQLLREADVWEQTR